MTFNSIPSVATLPRSIRIGPVELDLLRRDGLIDRKPIGLHPREFEVMWRLAETPDISVSRDQLLREVWHIDFDPQTNRVEVTISRIRTKLHVFRLSWLIATSTTGGYSFNSSALDTYIGIGERGTDRVESVSNEHSHAVSRE